jgi:deoxyribodipyrimidine photo-lyase
MTTTTVVWLGRDLRLDDNPALRDAASAGAVVPVFIWSPAEDDGWSEGTAARWWLHRSLESLDHDLRKRGSRLFIKEGPAAKALVAAAKECGAGTVSWNRRYEPAALRQEASVRSALEAAGLRAVVCAGNVLFEPEEIRTLNGGPYRVFTPYWNRCAASPGPAEPCGKAGALRLPAKPPKSAALDSLGLTAKSGVAAGMAKAFEPGESGARRDFETFLAGPIRSYAENRNLPASDGGSRLSPRLHFGELSVQRVWREALGGDPSAKGGFLGELGWRDFGRHVLFHYPHTPDSPLDERFKSFKWRRDAAGLKAWKLGMTGYPLVDAGMRELSGTGFMHNRVRMVTASFLTKDLLIDWREGARWFWDALVDADLASNTLNWQWAAGCGADAAPFFRIFNPVEQGRRFDATGAYTRRWVPELAALPDRWLHKPWEAPAEVLAAAKVVLGKTYPAPIVEHKAARERALEVFGASRIKP